MKVINANAVEIQEQDIFKKIERCGRVCYKSEGQITDGSALKFIKMLIDRNHLAMTEHAPIVLRVTERLASAVLRLGHGTFLNVTLNGVEERYIISGNVRAWINLINGETVIPAAADIRHTLAVYLQTSLGEEKYSLLFGRLVASDIKVDNNYMLSQEDVLAFPNLTTYEAMAHLYLTCLFTCDRGVSHEMVRMRVASFAQESTRYCNYSKDKFGSEITVIKPCFFEEYEKGKSYQTEKYGNWRYACEQAEKQYFALLDVGATPQEARTVLPNSLKTEVVMTCNLAEWQHVFNLRYHGTTGAPHPQMKEVMTIWYNLVMQKEGYSKWLK